MAISLKKFIEKHEGEVVATPDGNLPGQCVSLAQMYIWECFGYRGKAYGDGNTYAGNLVKAGLATKVKVADIKMGDIISYPAGYDQCDPEYGHVAIYYDKSHVFQQNVAGKAFASLNHVFVPKLSDKCTIARMKKAPVVDKTPTTKLKFKVGDKVTINGRLYGDSQGNNPGQTVSNKVTEITRVAEGAPYPYNTTGDLGWMAESSIKAYTATTTTLKVGDTVEIVGKGNTQANGKGTANGGVGLVREVLEILSGKTYPYRVGNSSGTTGFYKYSELKKR